MSRTGSSHAQRLELRVIIGSKDECIIRIFSSKGLPKSYAGCEKLSNNGSMERVMRIEYNEYNASSLHAKKVFVTITLRRIHVQARRYR